MKKLTINLTALKKDIANRGLLAFYTLPVEAFFIEEVQELYQVVTIGVSKEYNNLVKANHVRSD